MGGGSKKKTLKKHGEDSGFPSTLTEQQKEALAALKDKLEASKFRQQAKDHPDGDEFLLRVLRATMKHKNTTREFQPDEALERAEKILAFREKNNVYEKPENFEEMRKVYPRFTYKDRKMKKVLMFSRMGEFASRGKFSHFKEEEWERAIGFEMETMERAMRELAEEEGVENRGYITITDLKGVGLAALKNKKATVWLGNVSGENYPEMMDSVYLINVPWIFQKVYKLISPLLDPHTVSKFKICNGGVPKELKEQLDLDLLPKEFGGNRDVKVPYPKDCKQYKEEWINYDVDVN